MMLIGTAAIAQPSLGIGYLNSTDKVKSGSTTKTTNLSGFYVGGSYNINLAGSFGVAPGLYYGLATKSDADSYFGINTNVDVTEHGLVNRYTGDGDITRHRSQFNIGVAYLF